MTEQSVQTEQFTGLILLTGIDKAGIAASLFESLAPFAVHVVDIEQIVISERLILTVLIGLNPVHQSAIEKDLHSCALALDVDIATLFGMSHQSVTSENLVQVHLTSVKLHPRYVALVTNAITATGANIQSFVRTCAEPISICLTVSGTTKATIEQSFNDMDLDDAVSFLVNEI